VHDYYCNFCTEEVRYVADLLVVGEGEWNDETKTVARGGQRNGEEHCHIQHITSAKLTQRDRATAVCCVYV